MDNCNELHGGELQVNNVCFVSELRPGIRKIFISKFQPHSPESRARLENKSTAGKNCSIYHSTVECHAAVTGAIPKKRNTAFLVFLLNLIFKVALLMP